MVAFSDELLLEDARAQAGFVICVSNSKSSVLGIDGASQYFTKQKARVWPHTSVCLQMLQLRSEPTMAGCQDGNPCLYFG